MATPEEEREQSLSHLPRGLLSVARGLDKADSLMAIVERWLIAGCVIGMAVASFSNVIGRNLFNYSLPFTEEIMQILQIWLTFLGISYGARVGRHIRVTALLDMAGETLRKWLLVAGQIVTCALLGWLAWLAFKYVGSLADSGRVTPSLRWPLDVLYSIVPIGLGLGAVQFFMAIMRNLLSRGAWMSWKTPEIDAESGDLSETSL
ncbi:TRAP transporter small permease [Halomonas sp. McH1-25]|uniref:TRAP transporter small permease n=1 Tax=unclassified Halomonas TaxID=2609666 RepID=UPI001EF727B0|nr:MULTISPECIES: TRAP transporter small permease [unclassified Halomonas]MCG7599504.1 TRAP transporter small permease [Halomonas sp. McH1-25]MCP1343659.1 TRAP transporter small permease [Halomonas sp. FL8]MCP1362682.1 TRAP transporter small permease [Halomonas sp. BBD45]MCP1365437.1 TRAP transporter small permease [Halomonas sp. BBD48]